MEYFKDIYGALDKYPKIHVFDRYEFLGESMDKKNYMIDGKSRLSFYVVGFKMKERVTIDEDEYILLESEYYDVDDPQWDNDRKIYRPDEIFVKNDNPTGKYVRIFNFFSSKKATILDEMYDKGESLSGIVEMINRRYEHPNDIHSKCHNDIMSQNFNTLIIPNQIKVLQIGGEIDQYIFVSLYYKRQIDGKPKVEFVEYIYSYGDSTNLPTIMNFINDYYSGSNIIYFSEEPLPDDDKLGLEYSFKINNSICTKIKYIASKYKLKPQPQ